MYSCYFQTEMERLYGLKHNYYFEHSNWFGNTTGMTSGTQLFYSLQILHFCFVGPEVLYIIFLGALVLSYYIDVTDSLPYSYSVLYSFDT